MLNALIIGCGDIGIRVGEKLQQRGYSVTAVVRSDNSAAKLKKRGFNTSCEDLDQPMLTLPTISDGCLLFYFAPPTAEGERDLRMSHFLSSLASAPRQPAHIVYISTTAVYADSDGRWIDETAPTLPATARGKRRLDAEQQLIEYQHHRAITLSILRVAGIYSASRLPFRQIKARQPILKRVIAPYSNRIHADDLADIAIAAALNTTTSVAIFNASDGHPGSISQYFWEVAAAFALPDPPEITWEAAQQLLSPGMLSYLRESKRIDSRRLTTELGVSLRYPTLELGLQQCVAELEQNGNQTGSH